MKTQMKRMWINQPSKFQLFHRYHGKRVLVVDTKEIEPFTDVYFTDGDTISSRVSTRALSEGWPK